MATLNGYVDELDIIGPAAQMSGDPSMGAVGRPRYREFLQQGLAELSYDTPWDIRVVERDIPETGIVPLPEQHGGLHNIYLFNGSRCNPSTSVRVQIKENFRHHGQQGYYANNKYTNWMDYSQDSLGWFEPLGLYYAGTDGANLYLGGQSRSYSGIRIEYVGLGFDKYCQDMEMRIPMWAQQALIDYVAMRALEHRIFTDGKEALFERRYNAKLDQYTSPRGSWMTARARWAAMDNKDHEDVVIYMTGLGHGR